MSMDLSSPITGAAITGFTSPTYTLQADGALSPLQKQYIVSLLGGTQTGASAHSAGRPFTITMERPRQILAAAPVRTGTYSLSANQRNKWKYIIRKGGLVNANLAIPGQATVRIEIDIAAGMEDTSPAELKAMYSLIGGVFFTHANSHSLSVVQGSF